MAVTRHRTQNHKLNLSWSRGPGGKILWTFIKKRVVRVSHVSANGMVSSAEEL